MSAGMSRNRLRGPVRLGSLRIDIPKLFSSSVSMSTEGEPPKEDGANAGGNLLGKAGNFVARHPVAAAVCATGAVMVVAPVVVAGPALWISGFQSAGIASSSVAAAVHGACGNLAAHGVVATLQSAGAGGYGLPIVCGAVKGAGGAMIAGAGGTTVFQKFRGSRSEPPEPKQKAD